MCHSGGTQVRPPAVAVRDRPIELPDDELRLIFELLCCHALGVLSGVSRRWHILAQDCARARLIVARRIVPPAVSPLFSLGAFATLERFVSKGGAATADHCAPRAQCSASLSTAAGSSASSLPSADAGGRSGRDASGPSLGIRMGPRDAREPVEYLVRTPSASASSTPAATVRSRVRCASARTSIRSRSTR